LTAKDVNLEGHKKREGFADKPLREKENLSVLPAPGTAVHARMPPSEIGKGPALQAATLPIPSTPREPASAPIGHPVAQPGQFLLLLGSEDLLHLSVSGKTALHLIGPEFGHLIDESVDLSLAGLGIFHGRAQILPKLPHFLEMGLPFLRSGLAELFKLGLLLGSQVEEPFDPARPVLGLGVSKKRNQGKNEKNQSHF
jgi:hypothetical protein